ncbi:MAG: SpoIID/LytB domain-containing protein [Clostridium fessum]
MSWRRSRQTGICARTYAYRQIKANAYSRYGAHVDDSTNYQVYNNTESSERTNLAVKETDGKIVYYNDTPAETYYFSTSCGYSTDGTIWGASKDEVPYLKGIGLTEKKKIPDLTDNDTFLKFIQDRVSRIMIPRSRCTAGKQRSRIRSCSRR